MHWRFLTVALACLAGPAVAADAAQAAGRCVQFSSGRLAAGTPFTYGLPLDLEFRLRPAAGGWSIVVGPRAEAEADYLAPVSPPFRSAPHRVIGAAYGVSAADSVRVSPRRLRFVLTREDAQRASDIASAALLGDLARLKELDRLAAGSLTLRVIDGDADDEVVRWLELAGEACVP